MAAKYSIEFDTKEAPGKVKNTWVSLGQGFMRGKDQVRVDLCDHPLYPQLERYVLNNPSGAPKNGKK